MPTSYGAASAISGHRPTNYLDNRDAMARAGQTTTNPNNILGGIFGTPGGTVGSSMSGSVNRMLPAGGAQTATGAGGAGGAGSYQFPNTPLPPLNMNVGRDSQLQDTYNRAKTYEGQLSANSDHDAVTAMQRQRDLASGMGKEFGNQAAQRGFSQDSGAFAQLQSRNMRTAQQAAVGTNVGLASDARQKQLGAMQNTLGAASASANDLSNSKNLALSQWTAQQNAGNAQSQLQLSAAQLDAMRQQNAWGNQMQLAQLMSQMYTG